MNTHNLGVLAGILVGLAVGIGIVALLFKGRVLDVTFDERQQRARGQAYKAGFFTMLGTSVIYGFSETFVGKWCETVTGIMVCICVSVVVFAVICVRKEAYLSLKERPKRVMILFAALAVVNLSFGGIYYAEGELIVDGLLTFRAINPLCGLALVLILIVYIVSYLQTEKEDRT